MTYNAFGVHRFFRTHIKILQCLYAKCVWADNNIQRIWAMFTTQRKVSVRCVKLMLVIGNSKIYHYKNHNLGLKLCKANNLICYYLNFYGVYNCTLYKCIHYYFNLILILKLQG